MFLFVYHRHESKHKEVTMKSRTAILIGFALLLAQPFALQAQIPRTLSYQGIVTDASGSVKPDGTYSFTFKLYDVSSVGMALWTESKTISVKDGLFSTALGDQVIFPTSLIFDKSYWLGIQVGSEAELTPRVPLTSVGYSFSALRADTAQVATSALAAIDLADGVVTSVKIQDGAVTPVKINTTGASSGQALIFNGSNLNWQTPSGEGLTLPYSGTYSGGSNAFEITNTGTGQALKIHNQGTNYALGIYNDASAMYGIKISNDGNYPAIKITNYNSGNNDALEVNQNGTGYAGYFAGNVYTTGTYQGSDVRWKRNITTLEGTLSKVLALRGVQFEWNLEEYPRKGFREGSQIGLIAQEVEEVLPELVREDQDGYKAVDYPKVTAVLVEAIKEQQQEIEALKAAVAALQAQSDVALQE